MYYNDKNTDPNFVIKLIQVYRLSFRVFNK